MAAHCCHVVPLSRRDLRALPFSGVSGMRGSRCYRGCVKLRSVEGGPAGRDWWRWPRRLSALVGVWLAALAVVPAAVARVVPSRPVRSGVADPVRWPDRPGNLPPMMGGATVTWSPAAAGNWSTPGNWSTGIVPQAGDTVLFGALGNQKNCTLDVSTNNIASLDFTGYTGTFTQTGAVDLNVTTLLRFATGMTYTNNGSLGASIKSIAGNTLALTLANRTVVLAIWGTGTVSLQDDWSSSCSPSIVMDGGTLTTNGHTIWAGVINPNGAQAGTLNLGASNVNLVGSTSPAPFTANSNWTINAGTSTITCSAGAGITFAGAGLAYHNLVFTNSGAATLTGANTFANLTRTGTASQFDSFQPAANQTITGVLTLTGNSTKNRLLLGSNSAFTSRTFTLSGATVNATNVDYRDITITGSPTQNITSVGDHGGNTGVTVTPSSPQAWQSTSGGSFSVAGNWTSRIPLPQDDVTISKAFIASQTITIDMPRPCRNLDFTGTTGSPTLSIATGTSPQMTGSLTLAAGIGTMSFSAGLAFVAYSNISLTTAGKQPNNNIVFQCPTTATVTLQDDLTISGGSNIFFLLQGGTINANGHNVTAPNIYLGQFGLAWAATMGSGTWTVTSNGVNAFAANPNGTLTAGASTLVLSDTTVNAKTFTGGGYAYNNVSFTGGGTGAVTVTGSNTFAQLLATGPKPVIFTAGTPQTCGYIRLQGTSGNLVTLTSTVAGTAATLICTGNVECEFVSVKDITAAGSTPFRAGNGSTLVSNTTNWVLGAGRWTTDTVAVGSGASTSSVALSRGMAETVAVSDVAAGGLTLARGVSTTVAVGDSATGVSVLARAASESVVVSASGDRQLVLARAAVESVGVGDAAGRVLALARAAAASVLVGDAAVAGVGLSRVAADSVAVSDVAAARATLARMVVESVGVLDAADRGALSLSRGVSNVVAVADSAGALSRLARIGVDGVGVADAAGRVLLLGRTVGVVVPVGDAAGRVVLLARVGYEVVTVGDRVTVRFGVVRIGVPIAGLAGIRAGGLAGMVRG